MSETTMVVLPEDNPNHPLSQKAADDLVTHGLTISGHAATLRYLSEALQMKFGRAQDWEIVQLTEILEFVLLELEDHATQARALAEGWGNCQRRKKLGLPTDA